MTPNRGYSSPTEPGKLPPIPSGPAEGLAPSSRNGGSQAVTRYVLPDGSEIASLDVNGGPSADKAWVTHPSLGSILIDRDKLTEVPPPLPSEPPSGSAAASDYTVWLRGHGGWFDGFAADEGREFLTWERLNARHPELRVLVYDPAETVLELPYELLDGATRLRVEAVGKSVRLSLEEDDMCVSFDTDREHAPRVVGAIARAARDARRTQPTTQESWS